MEIKVNVLGINKSQISRIMGYCIESVSRIYTNKHRSDKANAIRQNILDVTKGFYQVCGKDLSKYIDKKASNSKYKFFDRQAELFNIITNNDYDINTTKSIMTAIVDELIENKIIITKKDIRKKTKKSV